MAGVNLSVPTTCPKGHEYTPENTYWQVSRGQKGRVCKSCKLARDKSRRKKEKQQGKEYKRSCPSCAKELIYHTKQHYRCALKNNTICVSCANEKQRTKLETLTRSCPKCKKLVSYKSRKGLLTALRRNAQCVGCSKRGTVLSDTHRLKLSKALKGKMAGEANPMFGKCVSFETRQKISKAHKGRIAGDKNPNWKSGDKHPNWKGGITPVCLHLRRCPEYIAWRTVCFIRDHYMCQNCGSKKNAIVHHIIHFSKLVEWYKISSYEQGLSTSELWNTNNGITLCEPCHYTFHGKQLSNDFNELKI